MFVKLGTDSNPVEWPLSFSRIKFENPNISFPADTSALDVSEYGYSRFALSDYPVYDSEYEQPEEITPVLSGNVYQQTWRIVSLFTDAERIAYDAKKAEQAPILNRNLRFKLLHGTDWTGASDVTMTPAMRTYRQALRDITTHANWPDLEESDWPTKPE